MPQLARLSVINSAEKFKGFTSVPVQITPALGSPVIDLGLTYNGVLTLSSNVVYNITPNVGFTANVVMWGAGGGAASGVGGGGGFTTAIMSFDANVSYNVVVGRAGSTPGGSGGGGSGIEYLANSNPILIAGGGGGGGASGAGGAGGGWFAANSTSSPAGLGATSYGFTSPGAYRTGGPSASVTGMGFGGAGPGGGGGGMYGGAAAGGGGGGSGWINPLIPFTNANTQTGSGVSAANPSEPLRTGLSWGSSGVGSPGVAATDGLIIISLIQ